MNTNSVGKLGGGYVESKTFFSAFLFVEQTLRCGEKVLFLSSVPHGGNK